MNSFGRLFRVSIFGESHGSVVGVIIDGLPAGLKLDESDFLEDLSRRQGGNLGGTTPRKEKDIPIFQSGLFNAFTTGAPLNISFLNENVRSADYEAQRSIPRPGHADFVAHQKFSGFEDYRGGGHFSGRLTVGIVAAGVVAKKLLLGVSIQANVIELGGEKSVDAGIAKAKARGDSVGGIIECRAMGLPISLGEPFWDSVESLLAHAAFAIPAVKGIEFGAGFSASRMTGSEHNDALEATTGKTSTNNAGGIVGGLSNGNELVFRIVVKPTSSTPKQQNSLNAETGVMEDFTVKGRHDLAIALRVPPVLEAMCAIVLADLMLINRAQLP
ncbi:MAG: chorismate synthase [Chitinophagaceae bacterium]